MNLPPEYQNVFITYVGQVYVRDKYYGKCVTQEVTRRAFYSKSNGYYDNKNNFIETPNGYFNVPYKWEMFHYISGRKELAPKSFAAYPRVLPENIISWKEC